MTYAFCVRLAWAGIEDTELFQRVKVSQWQVGEAISSRKVVCCEACTEGSEATNSGTDEQKRYTEAE